eukprot:gene261-883_t
MAFKKLVGELVSLSLVRRCAILHMRNGENRFNTEFINNLHEALDEVESCPEVEALITTGGAGEKFFSNGLDLDFLQQSDDHEAAGFMRDYSKLMARFLTFPMPTVAAINGHAFAGGGILAMAHDFRVMREDKGWICLNEIRLRLRFPPGLCEMLAAKSNNQRSLLDFFAFGRRYTGPEALSNHLVDLTCKSEDLVGNAILLAEKTVSNEQFDRATLRTMKLDLYKDSVSELTRDYTFEDLKLASPKSKF